MTNLSHILRGIAMHSLNFLQLHGYFFCDKERYFIKGEVNAYFNSKYTYVVIGHLIVISMDSLVWLMLLLGIIIHFLGGNQLGQVTFKKKKN